MSLDAGIQHGSLLRFQDDGSYVEGEDWLLFQRIAVLRIVRMLVLAMRSIIDGKAEPGVLSIP